MTKNILFISLFFCSLVNVYSQEFRLGLKGGLNIASLGTVTGLDSRVSFHAGVLAEIPLAGKFALQPEILYSSQGSSSSLFTLFLINSTIQLDYVNIPVLAKYYIVKGLSAEAGPVLGILVSAKQDVYNSNKEVYEKISTKENYKNFDAGIAFGTSYRLNMGILFSLRYNFGLINLREDDDDSTLKNSVFQISAGYSF